jgi:carbonic anhydrase
VAAQLGAMPTSPGFKMAINKGDTGAPEPGPVGARPIEKKPSAPAAAAASAATGTIGRLKPTEAMLAEAHAAEKADADRRGAAKPPDTKKADAKAEANVDPQSDSKTATATATAKADAKPTGAKAAPVDPMDLLRQKLAEKLGARPAADGKFVMRVSNRGESGENVITAVRPTAAALRAATVRHAAKAASVSASSSVVREATGGDADLAPHAGASLGPTRWDYGGADGPDAWGRLPESSKCATGQRQSPIDIRGGIAVDLEPIQFDYHGSAFSVIDNGHTVQVDVAPGNSITITGRRYELVQFHFHRPSEERINGRQYDMVVHLVHKDAQGHVAIVAVLLDRGSAQPIVQTVWNNLPLEKGDEVRGGTPIDLAQLLPADKRYYTYMGSLTTPPCSEGVLWMVMKQPVPISPEQVAIFSRLYPMNARPIQQADGRLIKESN